MNQRRHRLFVVAAALVFVLASAMQVTLSLRHPRWFKGNLHAHSNRNEGDASPAEVARWYRENDYQFLALSDHNETTDPAAHAEEVAGRFLVITAAELSGEGGIHVNAVAPASAVARRAGTNRRVSLFDNVEAVREAGGIPIVNHPRHAELTFNELMFLDGPFLMEIAEDNLHPDAALFSEPLWDRLLTAGRDVYGVAADDARYFKSARETQVPGTAWIAVRASSLDRDAIASAVRSGDFYASTGVALDDVRWDGSTLRVAIHATPGARHKTTFIGAGGRILAETFDNPALYRASSGDGYVRARVDSQEGRAAWTQAVRLRTGSRETATAPVPASVAAKLAAALDAAPLDGPVQRIHSYEGSTVRCDPPPDNSAAFAERLLASRRAIRGGAYETARTRWILSRASSVDLETVARDVRAAYDKVIGSRLPRRTVTDVGVQPMVLNYAAGYAGNRDPIDVRVKRIALDTIDGAGRAGRLTAYFVNYDKLQKPGRVVLLSTPHVPAEAVLGVGGESIFAGAAGPLAVSGVPLLLYDSTGTGASAGGEEWDHGLYHIAGDIQFLDAVLLGHFGRVDLVGSTESLVHLLASHRATIGSAYLVQFIPLWTRNDAAPRTGGPFGFNEDADHVVYQTQFQWADFLLAGIRDGVSIAVAVNAGASGLSKAGLLSETVPAMQRFTKAFEIRGDDPDGDGVGGSRPPVCGGFDPADVLAFLKGGSGR